MLETKSYKYLLFDWDGCLADTLHCWVDAYKKAYAEYGLHPTDGQISSSFNTRQSAINMGIPAGDFGKFENRLIEHVMISLKTAELYPGATQMLFRLKEQGKSLAVVTTGDRINIDAVLNRSSIRGIFEVIVAADDVLNHKPHPEPVEKALLALNGSKDSSIMIGDSENDLGAARNAGIDSVLYHPDSHKLFYDISHLKTFNPTYIVKDYTALEKILLP